MERYDQKISPLFELLQVVSQCSDLDRILDCTLDVVIDGLGMQNCGIDLREDGMDRFALRASRGLTKTQLQAIERFRQKPGGDFCQQVVDSGQAVFVPNLASNELFQDTLDELWGGSYVNVPLRSKCGVVGAMGLVTHTDQEITEYELEVLKAVGNVLGIAIDNALLVKKIRRVQHSRYVAVVDERSRLARELHDTLAQALGCMILKLNIADELLSSNQVCQAKSNLVEAHRISKTAYTDVRESIFSLRTSPSHESGFLCTLKEYLSEYETYYGLATDLVVESEDINLLSPEVGIQVFRIIQEALGNSRKHAQASRASILLQQAGDSVVVTIADDGRGFNPAEVADKGPLHLGLQIMHERTEGIGGKLEVDSSLGSGTRITIRVPVTQRGWKGR
ncbi:MAG: GAF domain-containing sensor histidine kinase [Coriobacteriaceae bacterium]|jgi:signal transduction histidine kinase|nr:GAF domain-containing sensor histidine kinase [Coriobacteriaceae bacterium]